jgi:peptidoglycan/xylan/chitin deacetylase (PgdA/CDA1 family)
LSQPSPRDKIRRVADHFLPFFRLAAACGVPRLLLTLTRGRARVLMYHGVCVGGRAEAPFAGRGKHVPAADFDHQMGWLARHMRPIGIEELVACLESGRELPPKSVVVTLDDGYRNNHDVALPILTRHRIPAVVYVSTGFIDGAPFWVDRIDAAAEAMGSTAVGPGDAALRIAAETRARGKSLAAAERERLVRDFTARAGLDLADRPPDDRPRDIRALTPDMLRALHRAGITIGSHTVNHESLSRCDAERLRLETVESKRRLEEWIDHPVPHFAYPNGRPEDFNGSSEAGVKAAGYRSALTTVRGTVRGGDSPWRIPRIAVNGGEEMGEFLADLSGLRPFLIRVRNYASARLRPGGSRRLS